MSLSAEIWVRAPATAANLGPGLDTLGVALSLHNDFRIRCAPDLTVTRVTATGEGASELSSGEENLVYRAVQRLYAEADLDAPPLEIAIQSAVPLSRGLGSSSSAIVAGLIGANALLGDVFDGERLLALATEIEGHPDNVAPALMGGFQVIAETPEGGVAHLRLPVDARGLGLRLVACIPESPLSTEAARRVLPATYDREDAVRNLGWLSLLVAALCAGRVDLLAVALQDRLHQPYRAPLVPGFEAAVAAATAAGAFGACLSGSGSTMLAFTPAPRAEAIGAAMTSAVRATGCPARSLVLEVNEGGAAVIGRTCPT